MEFKNIKLENQGEGIWVLTMNRPEALNALNMETIDEVERAQHFLMEKTAMEARVLLITGSGEKAFVAGADIKEMVSINDQQAKAFSEKGQKVFRNFEMLRMPVIALVNGFALGGGMELALSADFIFASENARFGLPEVSLGLMPGFGGCVRLSRVVGLNKAREIAMTGDLFSATAAMEMGLVQKVVPPASLMEEALKMARIIISRSPLAVAAVKRVVLDGFDLAIEGAMTLEATQFGRLFQRLDSREGMSAFVEKRKPQFPGK